MERQIEQKIIQFGSVLILQANYTNKHW